jgi:hypothetical protein
VRRNGVRHRGRVRGVGAGGAARRSVASPPPPARPFTFTTERHPRYLVLHAHLEGRVEQRDEAAARGGRAPEASHRPGRPTPPPCPSARTPAELRRTGRGAAPADTVQRSVPPGPVGAGVTATVSVGAAPGANAVRLARPDLASGVHGVRGRAGATGAPAPRPAAAERESATSRTYAAYSCSWKRRDTGGRVSPSRG